MRAHTRPTMAGDGGSLCSVIFCVFVTKGISLGQGENGRWNGRSGVRGRKRITRRRRGGVLCNGHEPTFAFCSPKRVFCNHLLVLATQKSHHSRRVTHTHTLNALANTLRLVGPWRMAIRADLRPRTSVCGETAGRLGQLRKAFCLHRGIHCSERNSSFPGHPSLCTDSVVHWSVWKALVSCLVAARTMTKTLGTVRVVLQPSISRKWHGLQHIRCHPRTTQGCALRLFLSLSLFSSVCLRWVAWTVDE